MIIISDCHAKFRYLNQILNNFKNEEFIQIGDMGILPNTDYPKKFPDNLKFFRGNHDSPNLCHNHPNYLGDYGYLQKYDIYYISGAWSINRKSRIEGLEWWPDEELSTEDFDNIYNEIAVIRPRVILSHDCPTSIMALFFKYNHIKKTKTGNSLERIFLTGHQPKYWLFGHHHRSVQDKIRNTHFIGLGELESCRIPE
jgi:hypothetical protein